MPEITQPEAGQFGILFDIDEVEKTLPWGNAGEHKLHWYGLTSGRFWIETSAGRELGMDWMNWRTLRTSHAVWLKLAGADPKDA